MTGLDINGWTKIRVDVDIDNYDSTLYQDCRQIRAYDAINDTIKLFGGTKVPKGAYTFDPVNMTFIHVNKSALSREIVINGETSWVSFGNFIHYYTSSTAEK